MSVAELPSTEQRPHLSTVQRSGMAMLAQMVVAQAKAVALAQAELTRSLNARASGATIAEQIETIARAATKLTALSHATAQRLRQLLNSQPERGVR